MLFLVGRALERGNCGSDRALYDLHRIADYERAYSGAYYDHVLEGLPEHAELPAHGDKASQYASEHDYETDDYEHGGGSLGIG